MKSIRLSLLVYFLALLALALGVVSLLVYRIVQETLADRNRATAALIQKQYEDLCAEKRRSLDEDLLRDARRIADHARIRLDPRFGRLLFEDGPGRPDVPPWVRRSAGAAGLMATGPVPNGNVVTALAAFQSLNVLAGQPRWPVVDVKFDDGEGHADAPPEHDRSSVVDYIQVQSGAATYRSPSLEGLSLSPHPEVLPTHEPALGPVYRNGELSPGVSVRWVVFRYPFRWAERPAARAGPPRGPRAWGTVEAGYNLSRQDEAFAPLKEQRDQELADVEHKTADSLAALRTNLLITTLATFAAVVVGVYFLVRLGLLPLQRLSEAVSKVSEKDFRLKFNGRRLPAELAPIVDRLRQTLEQLHRAFEREKQAAADISHELRTPVAALLTTIDVALRKPRKPEEYREVLEDCRASGQQMSQLVERLLTLARLDAGVDRLRVEPVDVGQLAEQCAALVRPLAEARGLALRLHSAGPAVLQADPAKLREVITNLLHNAIEYNRPDGSVDLTVARENGTLRLEVRDTGIGIAPEAQAHLFERFFRADPSRSADGLHAGLGLAIVKGYVDLMGGTVRVESAVGRGSTFCVELPAAPGDSPEKGCLS